MSAGGPLSSWAKAGVSADGPLSLWAKARVSASGPLSLWERVRVRACLVRREQKDKLEAGELLLEAEADDVLQFQGAVLDEPLQAMGMNEATGGEGAVDDL